MFSAPLWLYVTGGVAVLHLGLWATLLSNVAYVRSGSSAAPDDWPALTVCIPARNEASNLQRLLPSLLRQNYPDLEIRVWDDGSDDDTWAVLQSVDDPRLTAQQGDGPPDGWVGKVHALYQCTRDASGDCYLFLDADTELTSPDALKALVSRHRSAETSVSTGFPRFCGAAQLVVSLVPFTLLTNLPWPLVRRTALPTLSALNGQCWLIDATVYRDIDPHAAVRNAVLEDVAIGRLLKTHGHPPSLLNVRDQVSVYMYKSVRDAWKGFRKNAYLLLGGSPFAFAALYGYFFLIWILAPVLSPWLLASLYGLKATTDRLHGISPLISLLTPLSVAVGALLQLDSAFHHWTDQVTWKGRPVPSSRTRSADDARPPTA